MLQEEIVLRCKSGSGFFCVVKIKNATKKEARNLSLLLLSSSMGYAGVEPATCRLRVGCSTS